MAVPRTDYTSPQRKPFQFRPPRLSRRWVRTVQRLLPLLARLNPLMVPVEVSEGDLQRLRRLRGQRVVLTPNHPEGIEPYILFHISSLLGTEFNYIAAKEAFENPQPAFRWLKWLGVYAPIMQKLGIYSVVRGTADRESFRTTRELLVKGERWLVIFPEGEVCWQNDNVMPLQQGVAQFGFWALEDLARLGDPPPLHFVPVAIKFVFTSDVSRGIDRTLTDLETALRLPHSEPSATRYDRLRRVGEAVLASNEKRYGVRPDPAALFDERIQQIKEVMLARTAATLGVRQNLEQPILERIRELFNVLDRLVLGEPDDVPYQKELQKLSGQEVRGAYEELSRMLHLVAIHDGYVAETMSAERFFDVLGQLEWEVFRSRSAWGPRKAVVMIGTPINLTERLDRYRSDRRATRLEVTWELEESIRLMLHQLSTNAQPVELGTGTSASD